MSKEHLFHFISLDSSKEQYKYPEWAGRCRWFNFAAGYSCGHKVSGYTTLLIWPDRKKHGITVRKKLVWLLFSASYYLQMVKPLLEYRRDLVETKNGDDFQRLLCYFLLFSVHQNLIIFMLIANKVKGSYILSFFY